MMYKEIILLKYGNVVLTTETNKTNAVEKSTAIFIHSSIHLKISSIVDTVLKLPECVEIISFIIGSSK